MWKLYFGKPDLFWQFISRWLTGRFDNISTVQNLLINTLASIRKGLEPYSSEEDMEGCKYFTNDELMVTYASLQHNSGSSSQVVHVQFFAGEQFKIIYIHRLPGSWYRKDDKYWLIPLYHPELKGLAEELLREVDGQITRLFT